MLRHSGTDGVGPCGFPPLCQHMSESLPKRHGQDRNGTIAWRLKQEQRSPVPLYPHRSNLVIMAPRRPVRTPRRKGAAPTHSGRIRLIGGTYRRRLLPVIDSPGLRPTPDRVRETLFNWLGLHVAGANVLDLFSGTGALGLEALSRGARHVHVVEQQPRVAERLRENIATLEATAQATVHVQDAVRWLQQPVPQPFGLVFLDPPFHKGLATPCCQLLEERGWLTDDAFIYLEIEAELSFTPPPHWQLHRETRAGESHGLLFQRRLSPSA